MNQQKVSKYSILLLVVISFQFLQIHYAQDRPINEPTPLTTIGNMHQPANIRYATGFNKLDWYGSGDVNNDETVDSTDAQEIEGSTSYRADVDGDGTPGTANDKQVLEDFLKGTTPYLPGDWGKLKTKEEKISWLEKMLPIEWNLRQGQNYTRIENWPYTHDVQGHLNFNGISNVSGFIENEFNSSGNLYDSTSNGLLDIPAMFIEGKTQNNKSSSGLQVLVGDNPLEIDNFYMWEPEDHNKRIFIGGDKIDGDKPISVSSNAYLKSYFTGENIFTFLSDIIKYQMENDKQKGIEFMDGFVLRNSPANSSLELTAPEDSLITTNYFPPLEPKDLLDVKWGNVNVLSNPSLGTDFYFKDSMGTEIEGEVYRKSSVSIDDIVYPNKNDSSHFIVKKKFLEELVEKNVQKSIIVPQGTPYEHTLAKDSTYQTIEVNPIVDGVDDEAKKYGFELSQNYPNPFNPTTTITFSIGTPPRPSPWQGEGEREGFVSLIIYDVLGREIKTLINESLAQGKYELKFSAENLPSGIYFYRLTASSFTETRKMMLVK